MKTLVASRADEIRKARDEWDAEKARRDAIHDEQDASYRQAERAITKAIEDKIASGLASFNLLEFDVYVEPYGRYGGPGVSLRVDCNQQKVHDPSSALSWDYKAYITSDGEVVKESSSWSGLEACTEEAMASLKQTVAALEFLNSIDYAQLLNVETPNPKDFFTEDAYMVESRPDFESQLLEAELEEAIGQRVLFLGNPLPNDEYYAGYQNIFYVILGETLKQYKIGRIDRWTFDKLIEGGATEEQLFETITKSYNVQRVRKDRLLSALGKHPRKIDLEAYMTEMQNQEA